MSDDVRVAWYRADRSIVLAGLAVLSLLAWVHLGTMAPGMEHTSDLAMPHRDAWGWPDAVSAFVMWATMMVAMMVPTAAPMVLVFAALQRRRETWRPPWIAVGLFVTGYVVVWTGFSVVATAAQWGLRALVPGSWSLGPGSPLLGGGMLLVAGLYQWTPLKSTCLLECRSPMGFLSSEWRDGPRGAIVMGLRHGGYCTGCCWALMALLFVTGVMSLLWAAAIAAFALLEKVAPRGRLFGRIAGSSLVVAGVATLAYG